MQKQKTPTTFNFDDIDTSITKEYVEYAIDAERALHSLQIKLSTCETPAQIAMATFRTITSFYDAEWCGAVDVDLQLGIWRTYWWYSSEFGEMAERKCKELEMMDNYDRWYAAIQNHETIILMDTESVKNSCPEEYEMYSRLDIHSLIAVPFWMHSTGVIALKNPNKHKTQAGFIRLLSYAVITAMNEHRLMERTKRFVMPPRISNQSDVYISLFGELKITTAKGMITESELKSPKITRLLTYLLLSRRPAITPREIADAIWPGEEEAPGKNMKGLVYRFQQLFSLISDSRLIESTPNGYQINPKLNIFTDLKLFDEKWDLSLKATTNEDKLEILKKLVDLYQGDVLHSASSEHWILSTSTTYQYRYIGAVNELMKVLWEEKHYHHIHSYAAKAIVIMPHNSDIYFWLIRSMCKQGNTEMARSELMMAQSKLLEEEYETLIQKLQKEAECELVFS